MKPGDLLRIHRVYQGMLMDTRHGLLLSCRPLESILDYPEQSFNIKLLETSGEIHQFILNPEDEVEVLS